jgi:hypothetical protein
LNGNNSVNKWLFPDAVGPTKAITGLYSSLSALFKKDAKFKEFMVMSKGGIGLIANNSCCND